MSFKNSDKLLFPNCCEERHILGQEEEVLAQLKEVMAAHFCRAQWALPALPDEDITPSDVPADPPTVMQGPMTRARMRQLNLEVSSFLSDSFHTFEN